MAGDGGHGPLEFPREQLRYVDDLGVGEFGQVILMEVTGGSQGVFLEEHHRHVVVGATYHEAEGAELDLTEVLLQQGNCRSRPDCFAQIDLFRFMF